MYIFDIYCNQAYLPFFPTYFCLILYSAQLQTLNQEAN